MNAMASQITGVSSVCPTVCLGADQRKRQSSASLAFVRGIINGDRWILLTKGQQRKMFPFDDVIMAYHFQTDRGGDSRQTRRRVPIAVRWSDEHHSRSVFQKGCGHLLYGITVQPLQVPAPSPSSWQTTQWDLSLLHVQSLRQERRLSTSATSGREHGYMWHHTHGEVYTKWGVGRRKLSGQCELRLFNDCTSFIRHFWQSTYTSACNAIV